MNKISFSVYLTGSTFSSSGNSTTNIDDGAWHLVTCEYDGTNASIWVDGSQQNSANIGSSILSTTVHPFEIGGYCDGNGISGGNIWSGAIDDVRIYSRALTSAEVKALYALGTTKVK